MELTRRHFLVSAGAITLLLSPDRLVLAQSAPRASDLGAVAPVPEYRGWEDVWRRKWSWDRVVRCTHNRSNCMSACAWDVYVKDGIAWREEQAHTYDEGGRGAFRAARNLAISMVRRRGREAPPDDEEAFQRLVDRLADEGPAPADPF